MRRSVWTLGQRDGCPRTRIRDHVERQQEGDHLPAKESSLEGNQPCWPWLTQPWSWTSRAPKLWRINLTCKPAGRWCSVRAPQVSSRDRCLNVDVSGNRDQDKDLGAGSSFRSDPRKRELGHRECEAGVRLQGVWTQSWLWVTGAWLSCGPPGTVLEGREINPLASSHAHRVRVSSRDANALHMGGAVFAPVTLEKLLGRKQKVTLNRGKNLSPKDTGWCTQMWLKLKAGHCDVQWPEGTCRCLTAADIAETPLGQLGAAGNLGWSHFEATETRRRRHLEQHLSSHKGKLGRHPITERGAWGLLAQAHRLSADSYNSVFFMRILVGLLGHFLKLI